ncbi:virion structural protein [Vibrio phage BONAISHI]|nr:virion structural protein [Vibrio phage BONAISHI]
MPLFDKNDYSQIEKDPVVEHRQDTASVYSAPDKENFHAASMEGTPRTVTYYYQVLGDDDYPKRLDFGLHSSLQEYIKVENMIILDTGDNDQSKDENHIWEMRGEANVYPGIPVNQWDMFTAQLVDGRIGVFTVYEVPQETSIYAYSGYRISYELVSTLTDPYRIELARKAVNTLYFDPDNPTCPGVNVDELEEDILAKEVLPLVTTMIYDEYYDKDTRTMLVEKDGKSWYDACATEFFFNLIPRKVRGPRPLPQLYSVPSLEYIEKIRTIWDVLIADKKEYMTVIVSEAADIPIAAYHSSHIMTGISLIDISGVIHPSDSTSLWGDVSEDSTYPYVFSEGFYTEDANTMTPWDKKIMDVLNGEQYLVSQIQDELDNLAALSSVERFHRLLTMMWLLVKKL